MNKRYWAKKEDIIKFKKVKCDLLDELVMMIQMQYISYQYNNFTKHKESYSFFPLILNQP
jgi:ATP:corrinoid adenosyltransferase